MVSYNMVSCGFARCLQVFCIYFDALEWSQTLQARLVSQSTSSRPHRVPGDEEAVGSEDWKIFLRSALGSKN